VFCFGRLLLIISRLFVISRVNLQSNMRASSALVLCFAIALCSADEFIDIVVDSFASQPFIHKWKRSFGSGHAALTLRKDWRGHLKQARDDLGLGGVRYHGIFDDDMGPVVTLAPNGSHVYNFTLIDSTWDYLLANGVKPIVELSFMPAVLANCSWHGHCPVNPINCTGYWCTQCSKGVLDPPFNLPAPPCHSLEFHYQGIKQMPYNNDYSGWYNLVKATVAHAVQRYGLKEVQGWNFEVWNELWGMKWPTDYMALYNSSARAIKAVDPSLQVGGPATAGLDKLTDFVDACFAADIPFDFVSSHHVSTNAAQPCILVCLLDSALRVLLQYPTDGKNGEGPDACPSGAAWDPTCYSKQVISSRNTVEVPFFLTEYNVGCCLGFQQHDDSSAAAFIFRAVGELNEALDLYSYWTFTVSVCVCVCVCVCVYSYWTFTVSASGRRVQNF
jgi:xylan 1,4-beta-xylosidase